MLFRFVEDLVGGGLEVVYLVVVRGDGMLDVFLGVRYVVRVGLGVRVVG